jgi:hypothetical protein
MVARMDATGGTVTTAAELGMARGGSEGECFGHDIDRH